MERFVTPAVTSVPPPALQAVPQLLALCPDLQRVAGENEAASRLASTLRAASRQPGNQQQGNQQQQQGPAAAAAAADERMLAAALSALAALCERQEEARKALNDAGEVPTVVAALSHRSPHVQAAAAALLRSLSRSERLLRTALAEANAAVPLLELLRTAKEPAVKATAAAALCNIVLVFTPMRDQLVKQGVVQELVAYTAALDNPDLRLSAVRRPAGGCPAASYDTPPA